MAAAVCLLLSSAFVVGPAPDHGNSTGFFFDLAAPEYANDTGFFFDLAQDSSLDVAHNYTTYWAHRLLAGSPLCFSDALLTTVHHVRPTVSPVAGAPGGNRDAGGGYQGGELNEPGGTGHNDGGGDPRPGGPSCADTIDFENLNINQYQYQPRDPFFWLLQGETADGSAVGGAYAVNIADAAADLGGCGEYPCSTMPAAAAAAASGSPSQRAPGKSGLSADKLRTFF
eukprot:gene2879-5129_t